MVPITLVTPLEPVDVGCSPRSLPPAPLGLWGPAQMPRVSLSLCRVSSAHLSLNGPHYSSGECAGALALLWVTASTMLSWGVGFDPQGPYACRRVPSLQRDPAFQAPMSGSLAQTLSCLSPLIGLTSVRLGLRGLTEPPEGPQDPRLSQCHPPLCACWWAFCDQEAQTFIIGGFSLLHILAVLMPWWHLHLTLSLQVHRLQSIWSAQPVSLTHCSPHFLFESNHAQPHLQTPC